MLCLNLERAAGEHTKGIKEWTESRMPRSSTYSGRTDDCAVPIVHKQIIAIFQSIGNASIAIKAFLALFELFQQSKVARHCSNKVKGRRSDTDDTKIVPTISDMVNRRKQTG
jgi:hypothetical protein